jgi:hypothetical protein
MKSTVFWDVTASSPEEYTTSTSGLKNMAKKAAGRLLCLFFNPEDGDSAFLRNIGELLLDHMVSHSTSPFIVTTVRTRILLDLS